MTSRGMISARQRTNSYRPNGQVAQHVLLNTIEAPYMEGRTIGRLIAKDIMVLGETVIFEGEHIYLIASSAASNRYYVVVETTWECSAKDTAAKKMLIAKAKAYYQELVARGKAKRTKIA